MRHLRLVLFSLTLVCGVPLAQAQTSSLFQREMSHTPQQSTLTLERSSWTYVPIAPPRQFREQDIITVRVDEMARMQSEGEVQRRKNGLYDAVLKDWLSLDGFSIKPAPQNDGDPRMQGQLNQLYRAEGEMETRESLALNIACHIVDIRPNGNLVLEGHRQLQINNEAWEVSLSGICRAEDIGPDNVVLSRNIVDMQLHKRERGQVRDSYRRGWFTRWFDQFQPF